MIVLRQSYLDRTTEVPGSYAIVNLADVPPAGPLEPKHLVRSLQRAAMSVHGTAATFAAWTELLMTRPTELPDWGRRCSSAPAATPRSTTCTATGRSSPARPW